MRIKEREREEGRKKQQGLKKKPSVSRGACSLRDQEIASFLDLKNGAPKRAA